MIVDGNVTEFPNAATSRRKLGVLAEEEWRPFLAPLLESGLLDHLVVTRRGKVVTTADGAPVWANPAE